MAWARHGRVEVVGLPEEVGRMACGALAVGADELVDRAALLVSLGGDGTMLRSMRMTVGTATPVLGVNLGRLGFLAEIDVDEVPAALTAIDARSHSVEPRLAVCSELP